MSSAILDPITRPQTWDKFSIDGNISPGACEFSDVKRVYTWDIQKAQGTQGAATKFTQIAPAQFKVKIRLWLAKHFTEWRDFRQRLKYDPTKRKPGIFAIYYPSLADLDISRCTTEEIGGVVAEGKGMWSVTISLLEYFPPKPVAIIPQPSGYYQAKNDAAGTGPDPAIVKLQNQLQKLQAQAQGAA